MAVSRSRSRNLPRSCLSCSLCGEVIYRNNCVTDLKNELAAYFVGVKILEFSFPDCVELVGSGRNPCRWFDFCDDCFKKVVKAKQAFRHFLKSRDEWRALKADLRGLLSRHYDETKLSQKPVDFPEVNAFQNVQDNYETKSNSEGSTSSVYEEKKFINFEEIEIDQVKIEDDVESITPDYFSQSDGDPLFTCQDEEIQDPFISKGTDCDPKVAEVDESDDSLSIKNVRLYSVEETRTLVKIWCSSKYQNQLLNRRQIGANEPIWKNIATELFEAGKKAGSKPFPQRTSVDVKRKMIRVGKAYSDFKKGDIAANKDDSYFEMLEETLKNHERGNESASEEMNSETAKPPRKEYVNEVKRKFEFSKDETDVMMQLWSSEEYQKKFETAVNRISVWNLLAAELFWAGEQNPPGRKYPERDGADVLKQFAKLKSEYNTAKNKISGDKPRIQDVPYYEIFEKNCTVKVNDNSSSKEVVAPAETASQKTIQEKDCGPQIEENEPIYQGKTTDIKDAPAVFDVDEFSEIDTSDESDEFQASENSSCATNSFADVDFTNNLHGKDNESFSHNREKTIAKNRKHSTDFDAAWEKSHRAKRSPNFKEEETFAFLKIWSQEKYQSVLPKKSLQSAIWGEIMKEFREVTRNKDPSMFPPREFWELKYRIKNLKRIYRTIKNGRSNTAKDDFPYYELLDSVLSKGNRKAMSHAITTDMIRMISQEKRINTDSEYRAQPKVTGQSSCSSEPSSHVEYESQGESSTSSQSLMFQINPQSADHASCRCDVCGKNLSNPSSLRQHIITVHEKNFKFFCPICGVGRNSQSSVDSHIASTHTNKNNQVCSVCQKAFPNAHRLKAHMRIHTGERPYSCDECGRTFNHPQNLQRHRAVHLTEKPFKCKLCPRAFPTARHLWCHCRNTHKMEKKDVPTKKIVDEETLFQLVATGRFPRTETLLKGGVATPPEEPSV